MSRGGFDIAVTEEAWSGNEDRRWLGTRMGADQNRSVTLDVSTFLPAHVEAKGALPSGLVLGVITATGKVGPYDNAAVDGRGVASGLLFTTTKVGDGTAASLPVAADIGVAMFWGPGIVKTGFLPLFAGTLLGELDAAGQADLANFIRFEA
jgi:hypothetical protein